MQPNDVRVLKGAAVPTLAVGLVITIIAGAMAGVKGALGAGIGVVLVAAFFTVGLAVVSWAGRISPVAMMVAAILGYAIKVIVVMAILSAFAETTAFNSRVFALTAIACTLTWTVGEMYGFLRLRKLYVEPDVEIPGRGRG